MRLGLAFEDSKRESRPLEFQRERERDEDRGRGRRRGCGSEWKNEREIDMVFAHPVAADVSWWLLSNGLCPLLFFFSFFSFYYIYVFSF